jgi:monovalent cation:proton antiporter-2 (CPA2) family protein
MPLFVQLLIILAAVKTAGHLSARLGQPAVLGKLIVGVVIGPAMLAWVQPSELIREMSEIGVLLLMFIAGLETDPGELRKNAVPSLAVATGGILFPLAFGTLAGLAFDMRLVEAVFLGLILSATSVSITVQTLRELGKLKTRESAAILGAAVADDILVVILLAFMLSFLVGGSESLGWIIGKKALFFVLIAIICTKLVSPFMDRLSRFRVFEPVISGAVILYLALAWLAESLGVAGIIGAYAAGLSLTPTRFAREVAEKVEPIAYAVFVPAFFVQIGLEVKLDGLAEQVWLIVAVSFVAVLTKLAGCGLGAKVTGFSTHSSLFIGAGMVSRGEVALIIAAIGLQHGIMNRSLFTAMVSIVLVTTLVTPPLLKWLHSKKKHPALLTDSQ